MITSGFVRNETAITVTEGESIELCVELDFNLFGAVSLERPIVINLTTTTSDNSATSELRTHANCQVTPHAA